MHEWPLVIYTLFVQISVGAYITLINIDRLSFQSKQMLTKKAAVILQITIAVLSAAGMTASFFHLGSPLHSINVLNNLGESWLSAEILFQMLFFTGVVLMTLLQWKDWHRKGDFRKTLHSITRQIVGIVGVLLIIAMAKLYMLPTVPVWNQPYTLISFIVTAFTLGPIALLMGYQTVERDISASFSKVSAFVYKACSILLSIKLIFLIYLVTILGNLNNAGLKSFRLYTEKYHFWLILLILISVWVIILSAIHGWGEKRIVKRQMALFWILLFVAAIIERSLFYATYARIGL